MRSRVRLPGLRGSTLVYSRLLLFSTTARQQMRGQHLPDQYVVVEAAALALRRSPAPSPVCTSALFRVEERLFRLLTIACLLRLCAPPRLARALLKTPSRTPFLFCRSALGDLFRALAERLRLHAQSPSTAMWSPPPGSASSYASAGFTSGQRLSSSTPQKTLAHKEESPPHKTVESRHLVVGAGAALPSAVHSLVASLEGLSLRQAAALTAAGLDCPAALARASIAAIHKVRAEQPEQVPRVPG